MKTAALVLMSFGLVCFMKSMKPAEAQPVRQCQSKRATSAYVRNAGTVCAGTTCQLPVNGDCLNPLAMRAYLCARAQTQLTWNACTFSGVWCTWVNKSENRQTGDQNPCP